MHDAIQILQSIGSFPEESAVVDRRERYKVSVWRSTFTDEGAPAQLFVDDDVAALIAAYPESLSRRQILAIRHEDPQRQRRRILIATLMWGYGIRGMRFPNKITSYVGQLLQDRFALDYRLELVQVALERGELDLAYEAMTGIKGVQSAFFTKILYFLGKSNHPTSNYPLILDSMVGRSLAMLSGFHYMMHMSEYAPGKNSAAYTHYVNTMHKWAHELAIDADVLEFYLWHPPKQLDVTCRQHFGVTEDEDIAPADIIPDS